jgi:Peptidase family M49
MNGTAAKAGQAANLWVVPDIRERAAKFKRVEMPMPSGLTANERKMVEKLVDACHALEDIFWRQSDTDAIVLYQSLAGTTNSRDLALRRYLWINASRFDLLKDNRPFVGDTPMSPGRGFYPQGLTREQVEKFVAAHPEKKDDIYSLTTVVRWQGDQLQAIPYRVAYRPYLETAAKALREAAALSADKAFANFLRLRADALLSDDYFASDLAWLDLKNPKFDIIFAPYETYTDGLLGVKGSYGASVLIRNEEQSKKLEMFQKFVPQIQDALPLAAEDRPSLQGLETPMEVMDAPFRAGDLTHGYQAVADNLPNDPRVHEQKGSKKIFFKNFMDARVKYIVLPVAQRLLRQDQAARVTGEGYLQATVMHEISHGLGPAFSRTARGKVAVREAIGPSFSALEEAKADVVGMFGLKFLIDQGALPKSKLEEFYASYVGGIFRTVRFGVAEAHGRAEMMEFNYLSEAGAVTRESSGKYVIDYAKMPAALADLAKQLLEMEATGDRDRVEKWFHKYDAMPEDLRQALQKTSDIPVDTDPAFSFKLTVK